MPISKLKNLAILILLLANAALLFLLLPGRLAQRKEDQALRQSLSDLYAGQEVLLDPSIIPDTVTLYALELGEGPEAELTAAQALLGTSAALQQDSTRYLSVYTSPMGTCSISRTGQFSAQLTGQPESADQTAAAKRLLNAMGFSYDRLEGPTRVRAGVYTFSAAQNILGVPLFGGQLTLVYTNGSLSALDGVYFPAAKSLTRVSDRACLSAADALVQFLSARFDLGWVGSEIKAMTQGYLRAETASAAAVHLTPVWRLDTDTGSYYVDGMTGQISGSEN